MGELDLGDLLLSWETHLQAERKSANTVRLYVAGVRAFLAWCEQQGRPAVLDRPTVSAFTAGLLRHGAEAATARARQLAVRRFTTWLAEEGELAADPLLGMRPPKLDQKVVPVLSDGELRRLVKACEGKTLRDRRDEALVRLLAETGMRAGECVALAVGDVDVRGGLVVVRRGKGGRGRVVPFGPQTARSIDRYLRVRRGHALAHTEHLWLGDQGRRLRYDGLRVALAARARAAGIAHLTPHVLRHTYAHRWLAAGGTEGGLMATAGWSHRGMLDRYAAATRQDRAAAEARELNLGDL